MLTHTNNFNRIIVFGCSHSYWPPFLTWADILKINGINLINYAKPGCGNLQILIQLQKYLEYYKKLDDYVIVQPTYLSRLFDYYITKPIEDTDSFAVHFHNIKHNRICDNFLDIELVPYLDDYFNTMMESIHSLLLSSGVNFGYIQIESESDCSTRADMPILLNKQKEYIIPNLEFSYTESKNDEYRHIISPRKNSNHMNIMQHRIIAEKILKYLNKPMLTAETNRKIEKIHTYLLGTNYVDSNIIEEVIHEKNS